MVGNTPQEKQKTQEKTQYARKRAKNTPENPMDSNPPSESLAAHIDPVAVSGSDSSEANNKILNSQSPAPKEEFTPSSKSLAAESEQMAVTGSNDGSETNKFLNNQSPTQQEVFTVSYEGIEFQLDVACGKPEPMNEKQITRLMEQVLPSEVCTSFPFILEKENFFMDFNYRRDYHIKHINLDEKETQQLIGKWTIHEMYKMEYDLQFCAEHIQEGSTVTYQFVEERIYQSLVEHEEVSSDDPVLDALQAETQAEMLAERQATPAIGAEPIGQHEKPSEQSVQQKSADNFVQSSPYEALPEDVDQAQATQFEALPEDVDQAQATQNEAGDIPSEQATPSEAPSVPQKTDVSAQATQNDATAYAEEQATRKSSRGKASPPPDKPKRSRKTPKGEQSSPQPLFATSPGIPIGTGDQVDAQPSATTGVTSTPTGGNGNGAALLPAVGLLDGEDGQGPKKFNLSNPTESHDFFDNLPDAGKDALFRWAWRVTIQQPGFTEAQWPELCPIFENVLKGHLNAKKYVFQLEKGEETGKLHIQGYLNLTKRLRVSQVKGALEQIVASDVWAKPSMDEKGSVNYCSKLDTRKAGPYSFP